MTGTGQVGTYTHVNGTLVITFNANATSAAVDSVLQQLTYRNTSDNPTTPSVTINYTFSDGNAGAQGSASTPGIATGSIMVNITATNDAPTLDLDDNDSSTATGADYKGLYIPAGAAVPIADGDSLIGDVDDTNIESATITVTLAQPGDQLTFSGAPPAGIIVGGAGTTILTLTGSATKAAYETALEQVRFSNSLPAPDTTTRDITVVLNDGNDPSNTAHAFIQINNPPTHAGGHRRGRRHRDGRCGGRHGGRHRRQLHRSGIDHGHLFVRAGRRRRRTVRHRLNDRRGQRQRDRRDRDRFRRQRRQLRDHHPGDRRRRCVQRCRASRSR